MITWTIFIFVILHFSFNLSLNCDLTMQDYTGLKPLIFHFSCSVKLNVCLYFKLILLLLLLLADISLLE